MTVSPIPDSYRMATPYLIVNDAIKAIDFYKTVFEATELVRLAGPDGKVAHAELQLGQAKLMLADEYPDMGYKSPMALGGSPVSMLLYLEDVDAVYAKAIDAGAHSMMPISDQFDGDRRGTITDPFGHIWLLASKKENITYEEMRIRFERLMQAESGA